MQKIKKSLIKDELHYHNKKQRFLLLISNKKFFIQKQSISIKLQIRENNSDK